MGVLRWKAARESWEDPAKMISERQTAQPHEFPNDGNFDAQNQRPDQASSPESHSADTTEGGREDQSNGNNGQHEDSSQAPNRGQNYGQDKSSGEGQAPPQQGNSRFEGEGSGSPEPSENGYQKEGQSPNNSGDKNQGSSQDQEQGQNQNQGSGQHQGQNPEQDPKTSSQHNNSRPQTETTTTQTYSSSSYTQTSSSIETQSTSVLSSPTPAAVQPGVVPEVAPPAPTELTTSILSLTTSSTQTSFSTQTSTSVQSIPVASQTPSVENPLPPSVAPSVQLQTATATLAAQVTSTALSSSPAPASVSSGSGSGSGMSSAQVTGIAAGSSSAVVVIALLFYFIVRLRKRGGSLPYFGRSTTKLKSTSSGTTSRTNTSANARDGLADAKDAQSLSGSTEKQSPDLNISGADDKDLEGRDQCAATVDCPVQRLQNKFRLHNSTDPRPKRDPIDRCSISSCSTCSPRESSAFSLGLLLQPSLDFFKFRDIRTSLGGRGSGWSLWFRQDDRAKGKSGLQDVAAK